MSHGVAKEDAHEVRAPTRSPSPSIATPKKKERNSKAPATSPPSSAPPKQRSAKQSALNDESFTSRSLESPKKLSKSKRPVATILGHQLQLEDENLSHSSLSDPSLPEINSDPNRPSSWDRDSDLGTESRKGGSKHETSDGILHHLGSSAPELLGAHSLPHRLMLLSSGNVVESEADRMMIEQLKTRRDLYLRTVSLAHGVSEAEQEDIEILKSQESPSTSSDSDSDDEEEVRFDPRLRRASSVEQIFHSPHTTEHSPGDAGSHSPGSFESRPFPSSPSMKSPHTGSLSRRAKRSDSSQNFSSGEFESKHFGPGTETSKSSGPSLATLRSNDRIIKEGLINKKGRRGGWQRRYLALDKRRLYLFKSKTPNKAPKQIILLSFAQCKASPDTSKQPRFWIFDVFTPEKKFVLGTAHQSEMDSWIQSIQHACEGSMMDTLDTAPPTTAQLRRGQSNVASLLSQSSGAHFGGHHNHGNTSSGNVATHASAPVGGFSSLHTSGASALLSTGAHNQSSPVKTSHTSPTTVTAGSPATPPSSPERSNTPTGSSPASPTISARSAGSSSARAYAQKDIYAIREMPGNNVCCDCYATSPEWAVINLGTFICIDCSGIHRSLGVQISKVRSLTLDRWEQQHINKMREVGNAQINQIFEYSVPPYRSKPSANATLEERRYWIHSKYVKRSFFDPSKFEEYPVVAQQLPNANNDDLEALKPAILELLQTDKAFRKHVRSLLLDD